jgi:predicted DNA-binding protein
LPEDKEKIEKLAKEAKRTTSDYIRLAALKEIKHLLGGIK